MQRRGSVRKRSRTFDYNVTTTRSTGHAKYILHIIGSASVHDREVGRYLTQIRSDAPGGGVSIVSGNLLRLQCRED